MKFAQEISIFKPHAIEYEIVSLGSRITQTAAEIRLETEQTLTNYSTTVQMNSAISLKADEITSSVNTSLDALDSRISQTAKSISFTLSAAGDKKASLSMSYTKEDGSVVSLNSQTITITGVVAFTDLSTSGRTTINGSNIHGGTLILGGNNNENGQISMRNSSNVEIGTWTNTGLTVTNPNTLRTSLNTDGQLHVYRYDNSQYKEMGTLGKYTITRNGHTYNVIGLNALRDNVDGLALVINGNPYYAINAAQDPHGGMDFTGYGFRHYFDGDTYCEGTYKTACGYGWGGLGDEDDPIVYTAASVRIENWDGHGHFYAASSIRTDGTCSAGYMWSDGGYGESDRRVKENIVSLDASKSSSLIMGLKPVQFNYIKTPDSLRHGFIAQDVEEIADWDVVGENDQGIKGLLYTDLIADMVAVIQKQEERITDLERRIANG